MKKIIVSLMMGAMLLSNVVIASAKTVDTKSTASNAAIVSVTDYTVFSPQTDDPNGW